MRTLAAAAAAATVLGVALIVAADGLRAAASWGLVSPAVVALVLVGLSAVLASRHAGRRVGLLFLGTGWVLAASVLGGGYADIGQPRGWPAAEFVGRAAESWLWAFAVVPLSTVLLAIFPDGRTASPRWRLLPWLGWAAAAVIALGAATGSSVLADTVGNALWVTAGVGSIVSLGVRWRRSVGAARQQVKYLLLAALVVLLLYSIADLLPMPVRQVAFLAVPLSLLGAVALAVLRYRLYDIDVVIRRTVVFAGLTAVIYLAYLVVGTALGASPSERAALVAALLVATVAEPARQRLQRAATRLLFGRRDEPLVAMDVLRQRLQAATDDGTLRAAVAETVPRLVRTGSVRLVLLADGVEGTRPIEDVAEFPLVHQAELLGSLMVPFRDPGVPFGRADTVLLRELAHQVAAAAHAVRLRQELRAAADQTARAAGLERERLRRDLHDRLGPLLVGTGLTVEGLRRSTTADDVASGLGEVAGQLRSASGEVRRLVDRLAPAPVLDLGLTAAVREHLLRLDGAVGVAAVALRAGELGELPPGVPEAAYAIVLEAVNNVVRHSGARRAEVRIERSSSSLDLEVVDDGAGLPRPWTAGVGIASMRRRALELGGTFAVGGGDHGGTCVRASFPLVEESWLEPGPSASSSLTTTPSSGSGCADCSRRSPGSTSSARPPTPRQPSPQSAS